MAPATVLISGLGIAGPALAYWLARYGHRPILVERTDGLRTGGHAVDIRGTALEVVERMRLDAEVRDSAHAPGDPVGGPTRRQAHIRRGVAADARDAWGPRGRDHARRSGSHSVQRRRRRRRRPIRRHGAGAGPRRWAGGRRVRAQPVTGGRSRRRRRRPALQHPRSRVRPGAPIHPPPGRVPVDLHRRQPACDDRPGGALQRAGPRRGDVHRARQQAHQGAAAVQQSTAGDRLPRPGRPAGAAAGAVRRDGLADRTVWSPRCPTPTTSISTR